MSHSTPHSNRHPPTTHPRSSTTTTTGLPTPPTTIFTSKTRINPNVPPLPPPPTFSTRMPKLNSSTSGSGSGSKSNRNGAIVGIGIGIGTGFDALGDGSTIRSLSVMRDGNGNGNGNGSGSGSSTSSKKIREMQLMDGDTSSPKFRTPMSGSGKATATAIPRHLTQTQPHSHSQPQPHSQRSRSQQQQQQTHPNMTPPSGTLFMQPIDMYTPPPSAFSSSVNRNRTNKGRMEMDRNDGEEGGRGARDRDRDREERVWESLQIGNGNGRGRGKDERVYGGMKGKRGRRIDLVHDGEEEEEDSEEGDYDDEEAEGNQDRLGERDGVEEVKDADGSSSLTPLSSDQRDSQAEVQDSEEENDTDEEQAHGQEQDDTSSPLAPPRSRTRTRVRRHQTFSPDQQRESFSSSSSSESYASDSPTSSILPLPDLSTAHPHSHARRRRRGLQYEEEGLESFRPAGWGKPGEAVPRNKLRGLGVGGNGRGRGRGIGEAENGGGRGVVEEIRSRSRVDGGRNRDRDEEQAEAGPSGRVGATALASGSRSTFASTSRQQQPIKKSNATKSGLLPLRPKQKRNPIQSKVTSFFHREDEVPRSGGGGGGGENSSRRTAKVGTSSRSRKTQALANTSMHRYLPGPSRRVGFSQNQDTNSDQDGEEEETPSDHEPRGTARDEWRRKNLDPDELVDMTQDSMRPVIRSRSTNEDVFRIGFQQDGLGGMEGEREMATKGREKFGLPGPSRLREENRGDQEEDDEEQDQQNGDQASTDPPGSRTQRSTNSRRITQATNDEWVVPDSQDEASSDEEGKDQDDDRMEIDGSLGEHRVPSSQADEQSGYAVIQAAHLVAEDGTEMIGGEVGRKLRGMDMDSDLHARMDQDVPALDADEEQDAEEDRPATAKSRSSKASSNKRKRTVLSESESEEEAQQERQLEHDGLVSQVQVSLPVATSNLKRQRTSSQAGSASSRPMLGLISPNSRKSFADQQSGWNVGQGKENGTGSPTRSLARQTESTALQIKSRHASFKPISESTNRNVNRASFRSPSQRQAAAHAQDLQAKSLADGHSFKSRADQSIPATFHHETIFGRRDEDTIPRLRKGRKAGMYAIRTGSESMMTPDQKVDEEPESSRLERAQAGSILSETEDETEPEDQPATGEEAGAVAGPVQDSQSPVGRASNDPSVGNFSSSSQSAAYSTYEPTMIPAHIRRQHAQIGPQQHDDPGYRSRRRILLPYLDHTPSPVKERGPENLVTPDEEEDEGDEEDPIETHFQTHVARHRPAMESMDLAPSVPAYETASRAGHLPYTRPTLHPGSPASSRSHRQDSRTGSMPPPAPPVSVALHTPTKSSRECTSSQPERDLYEGVETLMQWSPIRHESSYSLAVPNRFGDRPSLRTAESGQGSSNRLSSEDDVMSPSIVPPTSLRLLDSRHTSAETEVRTSSPAANGERINHAVPAEGGQPLAQRFHDHQVAYPGRASALHPGSRDTAAWRGLKDDAPMDMEAQSAPPRLQKPRAQQSSLAQFGFFPEAPAPGKPMTYDRDFDEEDDVEPSDEDDEMGEEAGGADEPLVSKAIPAPPPDPRLLAAGLREWNRRQEEIKDNSAGASAGQDVTDLSNKSNVVPSSQADEGNSFFSDDFSVYTGEGDLDDDDLSDPATREWLKHYMGN